MAKAVWLASAKQSNIGISDKTTGGNTGFDEESNDPKASTIATEQKDHHESPQHPNHSPTSSRSPIRIQHPAMCRRFLIFILFFAKRHGTLRLGLTDPEVPEVPETPGGAEPRRFGPT